MKSVQIISGASAALILQYSRNRGKMSLTEAGRAEDDETHSVYVEYLCVTDHDKSAVILQEEETPDYRRMDRNTLLRMKQDELITERIQLFLDELKDDRYPANTKEE